MRGAQYLNEILCPTRFLLSSKVETIAQGHLFTMVPYIGIWVRR